MGASPGFLAKLVGDFLRICFCGAGKFFIIFGSTVAVAAVSNDAFRRYNNCEEFQKAKPFDSTLAEKVVETSGGCVETEDEKLNFAVSDSDNSNDDGCFFSDGVDCSSKKKSCKKKPRRGARSLKGSKAGGNIHGGRANEAVIALSEASTSDLANMGFIGDNVAVGVRSNVPQVFGAKDLKPAKAKEKKAGVLSNENKAETIDLTNKDSVRRLNTRNVADGKDILASNLKSEKYDRNSQTFCYDCASKNKGLDYLDSVLNFLRDVLKFLKFNVSSAEKIEPVEKNNDMLKEACNQLKENSGRLDEFKKQLGGFEKDSKNVYLSKKLCNLLDAFEKLNYAVVDRCGCLLGCEKEGRRGKKDFELENDMANLKVYCKEAANQQLDVVKELKKVEKELKELEKLRAKKRDELICSAACSKKSMEKENDDEIGNLKLNSIELENEGKDLAKKNFDYKELQTNYTKLQEDSKKEISKLKIESAEEVKELEEKAAGAANKLKNRIKELENGIKAKERVLNLVNEEKEKISKELSNLEINRKRNKEDLKELKNVNNSLKTEKHNIQLEIKKVKRALNSSKKANILLLEKLKKLEERNNRNLKETEQVLLKLKEKNATLKSANKNLKDEYSSLKKKQACVEKDLAKKNSDYNELQKKYATLQENSKKKISKLKIESAEEVKKLREKAAGAMKKRQENYETNLKKEEEKYNSLKCDYDSLKNHCNEQNSELKQKERALKKLKASKKEFKNKFVKRINRLTASKDKFELKNASLSKHNKKLEGCLKRKRSSNLKLQKTVNGLEKEKANLEKKLNQLNERKENCESEVKVSKSEILKLKKGLDTKNIEILKIKKDNDRLKDRNILLRLQNIELLSKNLEKEENKKQCFREGLGEGQCFSSKFKEEKDYKMQDCLCDENNGSKKYYVALKNDGNGEEVVVTEGSINGDDAAVSRVIPLGALSTMVRADNFLVANNADAASYSGNLDAGSCQGAGAKLKFRAIEQGALCFSKKGMTIKLPIFDKDIISFDDLPLADGVGTKDYDSGVKKLKVAFEKLIQSTAELKKPGVSNMDRADGNVAAVEKNDNSVCIV